MKFNIRKSKIIFLLIGFVVVFHSIGYSQNYLGLKNSNFSGIYGVSSNPASMVDSRLNFDMNLFGLGLFAGSDYIILDPLNGGLTEKRTEDRKFAYFNLDVLGPSAFAAITIKDGQISKPLFSIGVITKYRTAMSVKNIARYTAALAYNGLSDTTLHNTTYGDNNFTMDFMTWGEAGVALGFQAKNTNDFTLNFGLHIKKLYGMGAFYLQNTGVRFRVLNKDSIIVHGLKGAEYAYASSNLFKENGKFGIDSPIQVLGSGYGFDIGMVAEYRPGIFALGYEDRLANSKNKYLYRLGVSLKDIGGIDYTLNSKGFIYDGSNQLNRKEIDSVSNPETLNHLAQRKFVTVDSFESFRMKLPTALDVNLDINLNKKIYVNINFIKGFAHTKYHGIKAPNYLCISPRVEKKTFEFALPISFIDFERPQIGFMIRTGSLIFGMDSGLSLLTLKQSSADFYFMFRIPFYRK